MGMDVSGVNPKSGTGSYFRNNVWWWRPLWDYCEQVGSKLIPHDNLGHTNDGWGLGGRDSEKLAKLLQAEIDSGRCQEYSIRYKEHQDAVPDEECWICNGTGVRNDDVGVKMGQDKKVIDEAGHPRNGETGWCNGCNGVGHVRPHSTHYPFDVENVQEFANFLRDCGGFEIC